MTRARLFTVLDQRNPLTVVRAPLGFGKTTLVARWASHQQPDGEEALAWVRVRPAAGDASSFWADVVQVLADAAVPVPANLPGEATTAGAAVIERMVLEARRPVLLVVDGFESLPEGVDQALLDLLRHAAPLRLIVCGRSHRHFPAHQYVDLDTAMITANDLLFTAEETAQLFDALGLEVPRPAVDTVHKISGGWPEPTRALAVTLRNTRPSLDTLRATAQSVALDYLRRHVLPEVVRPERVEFALATSIAEEFSAPIAELLSEDPDASAQLDWLAGEGVLLAELRDGQPVYRWPDAARHALHTELRRRAPERVAELHSRLATHLHAAGSPAAALRHAVRAADWPLAVRVIDTSWRTLLLGHRDELHEALHAIPLQMIGTSARALAVRDIWLRAPDDRVLSAATLPASGARLARLGRSEQARDVLETGLALLAALRRRGLFHEARRYAERLLEVATSSRVNRPDEVADLVGSVHLIAGQTQLLAADLTASLVILQRAYDWAGNASLDYVRPDAAASLALVHALLGHPHPTDTWLKRYTNAPTPATWLEPTIRGKAETARLLLALDRLDLQAAQPLAARDPFPDRTAVNEWWAFRAYAAARHALHTAAALDGLEMLDQTRALHHDWNDHGALAGPLLASIEADLLLALDRAANARAVLTGPHREHPLMRVGQARLALLSGDAHAALRLATDTTWLRSAGTRQRLEMLLIQAAATHRNNDEPGGADCLQRAITTARTASAMAALTTIPRGDLTALAQQVPAATALLAIRPLREAPDPFPSHVTLTQLTPREQRVLEKLAEGLSLQQTADALVVSYNTIRTQQASLYRKLGTNTRTDAIARARQQGLLPNQGPN